MKTKFNILLFLICFAAASGTASADVEFQGSIKTNDGSTFKGKVMAPTPQREGVLRFEYQGNPVDVKIEKISRITRQSEGWFQIVLITGGTYPVTVENENIYNTFSGPLILTTELGNVYIKPEKIEEILISHPQ